jgi:hypothetical protein
MFTWTLIKLFLLTFLFRTDMLLGMGESSGAAKLYHCVNIFRLESELLGISNYR